MPEGWRTAASNHMSTMKADKEPEVRCYLCKRIFQKYVPGAAHNRGPAICPFCGAKPGQKHSHMCGLYGLPAACPVCSGDCSSANPPVLYFPMRTDGRMTMTDKITDEVCLAALRGWCNAPPNFSFSPYQQSEETKAAWRRAIAAALVAMGIGEPVSLKPLIRCGEGEPVSDPGLVAGSPMHADQ